MKRQWNHPGLARQAILLLALSLVAVLAACDSHVQYTPTQPWPPGNTQIGDRNLQITGSLHATNGSIVEATILFDGFELPAARVRCSSPDGCPELSLAGTTRTGEGVHTISFRVLEQSREVVEYRAEGMIVVHREGLGLGGVTLALGPEQATLHSGESVIFQLEFSDHI